MIIKPSGCATCPLKDKGVGFVPDKISKKHKFMFIWEAPGKNEVEAGEPFVGKAGFVLKNWGIKAVPTLQLALERGEVSFGNTLRCLPPEVQGRPYPKGEEKLSAEAHCRQYDQDDTTVHTKVLFGESPQRAWFGSELAQEDASDRSIGRDLKGVGGRIGRVYTKDGKQYVFAPHPAWVLRQPSLVEHLQESLRISSGVEKVLEPKYYEGRQGWEEATRELLETK